MKHRHTEIIRLLENHPMMRIDDLCAQLNVSQATIRRDLTLLRDAGVERVGGAAFLNKPAASSHGGMGANSAARVGCIVSVAYKHSHMYPYYAPILEGIEQGLAKLGCSLNFIHNLDEIQNESVLHKILHESDVNGIIIVEGMKPEIYEKIKMRYSSIVGIDISDHTVPIISFDRIGAAASAVRHLIDQGHTSIGYIGGPGLTGTMEREKRFRGYKQAMQDCGLEIHPDWVINAGWDVNASYSLMQELLDRYERRPTAMFAASDMMAISAMRAAAEKGMRIPDDIAFIGLDNIEISQYTNPPLSSVHIPKFEIGMAAAKTFVDYWQGAYTLPYKMYMPYQIIVRQSSSLAK